MNMLSHAYARRGALLAALLFAGASQAGNEREETLVNRNTTLNLIEALVQRGVLDRATADTMIKDARDKAVADARAELAAEAATPAAGSAPDSAKVATAGEEVHVYYIPQAVKDELGREVGDKLRREVANEVKQDAKREAWGVPAALPEWVNRLSLSGDLRIRGEADLFGSENQRFSYFNWPRINDKGQGVTGLGAEAFDNTTVDRLRLRNRLRLGVDAAIVDGLKAGVRLSTSNDRSPVSLDQNLGQYGRQYDVAIDRAFVQYDWRDDSQFDWLTVWGGRHANPWFSTETLFDRDLSFEGVATTLRLPLGHGQGGAAEGGGPSTNWGVTQARSLFLTVGASPLEEVDFSPHDKWLVAAQSGLDWGFGDDSRFKFGVAYYDYRNVAAQPNALNSRAHDYTAPGFFTKGNSLARISNDIGETAGSPRLVGLASDFNILDVTAVYDYAGYAPVHVILSGGYSRNLGFDRAAIRRRTGEDIEGRTAAYELRVDFGYPRIRQRHDWNVEFAYKRVDRDAVLDAYTDSTFHLGGTDAKGWIVGASYGLATNTWVNARWMSADAIDGPPLGVDVLQLDLNTGF